MVKDFQPGDQVEFCVFGEGFVDYVHADGTIEVVSQEGTHFLVDPGDVLDVNESEEEGGEFESVEQEDLEDLIDQEKVVVEDQASEDN